MSWYYCEKEFYDYAADVEGVNIHYLWTPLGGEPDWEAQRLTRFMPLVYAPAYIVGSAAGRLLSPDATAPGTARLRKKVLRLPERIHDTASHAFTDRYLLHYYFEVFQGGHRYYSPRFTEEIVTGAGGQPAE
jgi:hypothetical protein